MSIERMLVVSTGNVSQAAMELIESGIDLDQLVGWKRDVGAMINVSTTLERFRDAEISVNIPLSMKEALELAEKLGCEWLLFDCAAELDSRLGTFDW